MKLRDKFKSIEPDHKNYLEGLEEVADEFAIDFAKYIHNNPTVFNNGFSMEMVLEYYKNLYNK